MIVNFETQKGRFAFVSLPNEAKTANKYRRNELYGIYYNGWNWFSDPDYIVLSDNYFPEYSIVGFVKDLTEEQWEEVVDWNYELQCYYLYPSEKWEGDITATESGKSLIESLNLDNSNWLLIRYDN
jgi:hypothetical protein